VSRDYRQTLRNGIEYARATPLSDQRRTFCVMNAKVCKICPGLILLRSLGWRRPEPRELAQRCDLGKCLAIFVGSTLNSNILSTFQSFSSHVKVYSILYYHSQGVVPFEQWQGYPSSWSSRSSKAPGRFWSLNWSWKGPAQGTQSTDIQGQGCILSGAGVE